MVSPALAPVTHLVATGTIHAVSSRVATTWQWYVVRASGFVGAGLLILLMLSGIGQVTGLTYRFLEPLKAWALHKAMALALCGAVAVHATFLLLDHFISFSLPQILVPFLSDYNNKSSLFGINLATVGVASGILAMYGIVVLVLSSLGWIDSNQKLWRWLHYLSYFVILAVFVHALGVGSDLRYGTFRNAWIAIFLVVLLAVFSRLLRSGTLRKKAEH